MKNVTIGTETVEVDTVNGTTYYSTEIRKVRYCASVDQWGTWTVTVARFRAPGSAKFFDSIHQMEEKKMFRNLAAVIRMDREEWT
jgi:hypothetical protein